MVIYKIENQINHKVYVGQTIKAPETRWKEHLTHSRGNCINDYDKHLYRAMRKYGIENFTFEVLQDNIETQEELDEAEIYWINYYNSFIEGYNETFGGQRGHRKLLPRDEITQDYLKTRSMNKTAKNFGICVDTVSDLIKAAGVEPFSFRQAAGKRIKISKKNFEKIFDSVRDCAEWFIEQKIPTTNSAESVRTSLKIKRRSNCKNPYYYGYLIENIEE